MPQLSAECCAEQDSRSNETNQLKWIKETKTPPPQPLSTTTTTNTILRDVCCIESILSRGSRMFFNFSHVCTSSSLSMSSSSLYSIHLLDCCLPPLLSYWRTLFIICYQKCHWRIRFDSFFRFYSSRSAQREPLSTLCHSLHAQRQPIKYHMLFSPTQFLIVFAFSFNACGNGNEFERNFIQAVSLSWLSTVQRIANFIFALFWERLREFNFEAYVEIAIRRGVLGPWQTFGWHDFHIIGRNNVGD